MVPAQDEKSRAVRLGIRFGGVQVAGSANNLLINRMSSGTVERERVNLKTKTLGGARDLLEYVHITSSD